MSVAARVITLAIFVAVVAVIDVTTQGFGSAVDDRPHCLPMAGQHSFSEFGLVVSSVTTEDVGKFNHARSAMSWSMALPARSSARRVK
jgi:hypothetical protein